MIIIVVIAVLSLLLFCISLFCIVRLLDTLFCFTLRSVICDISVIDGDICLFDEGLVDKMEGATTKGDGFLVLNTEDDGDGFFVLNTEDDGDGFFVSETEDGSVKFSPVINGEGETGKVSVFSVKFTSVLFV
jgi:hypothetical protein